MKSTSYKTPQNSMHISKEKLLKFVKIFEQKTGKRLPEQEALVQAETLLRTISILYKPVATSNYYSAMAKKLFFKTRFIKNY